MATDAKGNEIGKLFVGGLHQSTTNDDLRNYFSKFGEIEDAIVMMDNNTQRSRGFGYVKFTDPLSVDKVINSGPHILNDKEIDPKQCNVNMKGKNRRSLKIFVGGIAPEVTEAMVRDFFSQYGTVTDVNLMIDPAKQRHRGFAFVGFDDEDIVKRLIQTHYVVIGGKQVEMKAMEPPNNRRAGMNMSAGLLSSHMMDGAHHGLMGAPGMRGSAPRGIPHAPAFRFLSQQAHPGQTHPSLANLLGSNAPVGDFTGLGGQLPLWGSTGNQPHPHHPHSNWAGAANALGSQPGGGANNPLWSDATFSSWGAQGPSVPNSGGNNGGPQGANPWNDYLQAAGLGVLDPATLGLSNLSAAATYNAAGAQANNAQHPGSAQGNNRGGAPHAASWGTWGSAAGANASSMHQHPHHLSSTASGSGPHPSFAGFNPNAGLPAMVSSNGAAAGLQGHDWSQLGLNQAFTR